MIEGLYPIFRHWSKEGSVYLFSDPHFNDKDSVAIDPTWPSPMQLVNRINTIVHKNDTLLLLGDVGDEHYLYHLKGHIVLVLGNHDGKPNKYADYCDEIYSGPLWIGQKLLLSHEPIYGIPYVMNIHGHEHIPSYKEQDTHLNVCSNVIGFKPISLGEIIKRGLYSKIPSIHRWTIDKRGI